MAHVMTGPATPAHRVAVPPPGGQLLVTVGGSPVPVLLTLLGLRPARMVALVSERSAPVWGRIRSAAVALDPQLGASTAELVVVPPFDGTAVAQAAGRVVGAGGWDLAYSGGTPAMSGGAFAAWWAARTPSDSGSGTSAWYVAEEGDALIRHDGGYVESRDVMAARNLSLAEMLRLHGLDPVGLVDRPTSWEPHACEESPAQLRAALRELPRGGPPSDMDRLVKRATDVVTDAVAVLAAPTSMDVYAPVVARRPAPVGAAGVGTFGLGISVIDGLSYRMIHVASYTRNRSGERLTRDWRAGPLKELLFDAAERAQLVGGLRADTGLLSLAVTRGAPSPVAALWSDQGPWTAPDRLPDRPGQPGEQPLPATTAFALDELYGALVDAGLGLPPAQGNDLSCWMCGGQP